MSSVRSIAIIKSDTHVSSALKKAIKDACDNCEYVRVEFVTKHKSTRVRLAHSLQKEIGHIYNICIEDGCCLLSNRKIKQRYKLT